MKNHYSSFKYHNYIIEGCGREYELLCKDGIIGRFSTCQQCKNYVDRERNQLDEAWNNAVSLENSL